MAVGKNYSISNSLTLKYSACRWMELTAVSRHQFLLTVSDKYLKQRAGQR